MGRLAAEEQDRDERKARVKLERKDRKVAAKQEMKDWRETTATAAVAGAVADVSKMEERAAVAEAALAAATEIGGCRGGMEVSGGGVINLT